MHMYTIHKSGKREPAALTGRFYRATDDLDIVPWNDPNHYCRSCETALSSKRCYHRHIKIVQSLVVEESKLLSITNFIQSMPIVKTEEQ